MNKIEFEEKLDFNNVLIRPKRSTISSRSQIGLNRKFKFKYSNKIWDNIPIIAANMDTTGTFEVYDCLKKNRIVTALHKFYKLHHFVEKQKQDLNYFDPDLFMVSTGISDNDLENLIEILSVIECNWICVDIANGYIDKLCEFCTKVRNIFPNKIIVAGEAGGSIPEIKDRISQLWGNVDVIDHHGMTEVGPVTYQDPNRPSYLNILPLN